MDRRVNADDCDSRDVSGRLVGVSTGDGAGGAVVFGISWGGGRGGGWAAPLPVLHSESMAVSSSLTNQPSAAINWDDDVEDGPSGVRNSIMRFSV